MGRAKMSKKCPKSREDGNLGHPFIMGASSDAFFCYESRKIGHFGWPNLGFSTSKVAKTCHNLQPQHTTHNTQQPKMSRRHPTLHRLCHLSPWAGYWCPQPMAPRIPWSQKGAHDRVWQRNGWFPCLGGKMKTHQKNRGEMVPWP